MKQDPLLVGDSNDETELVIGLMKADCLMTLLLELVVCKVLWSVFFILKSVQSQLSSASWSLRYFILESTNVSSSLRRCSDCELLQTLFLKNMKNSYLFGRILIIFFVRVIKNEVCLVMNKTLEGKIEMSRIFK